MRVWLEEAQGALAKASGIDILGLKLLSSEKLGSSAIGARGLRGTAQKSHSRLLGSLQTAS
jgi:hypothetical protein